MEEVPPFSKAQRVWFASVVILGAVFLFALPPFQGADEHKHWLRAWSVAEGQVTCSELPQAAVDARAPFRTRSKRSQIAFKNIDSAISADVALGVSRDYAHQACPYPPYAYVLPALVIRAVVYGGDGTIGRGDTIKAFYAARIASWICMCVGVFWFLRVMPVYRNVTLFFFSIPEVIDQTAALNTELTQFILMFVMVWFLLRAPSRRAIAMIGVSAVLLAMIKPVFVLFGLVALPALIELRAAQETKQTLRYVAIGALLLLLPIISWKVWSTISYVPPIYPEGTDPGAQLEFLKSNPLHLFTVFGNQVENTFGHNLMKGSWTSVLGGFGPARIELPMTACYVMLLGLALSIFADHASPGTSPPITPLTAKTRLGRAGWFAAVFSIAMVGPAAVVAMYFVYSKVGADEAYGVQGRYYLVPLFMLLVLGVRYMRGRWPRSQVQRNWREVSIWVAAITCVWADSSAILALAKSYWSSGV